MTGRELVRELRIAVSDGRRGRDVEPTVRRLVDQLRGLWGQTDVADRPRVALMAGPLVPVVDAILAGEWDEADRLLEGAP